VEIGLGPTLGLGVGVGVEVCFEVVCSLLFVLHSPSPRVVDVKYA